jgi:septal ring factor EnvC (AmiA/AmiB activator)
MEAKSSLERLREKYGVPSGGDAAARVFAKFDEKAAPARRGLAPKAEDDEGVGELHREMAAIRLALARLAKEYGKLNVTFANLLGPEKVFSLWDGMRIKVNEALGRDDRATEIQLEAVQERGDALDLLVNKMAEVMTEQHQKAIQGRDHARQMQVETLAEIKRLDRKLIEELRGGQYTTADLAAAEQEAVQLQLEMAEIDQALADYQTQIQTARDAGDLEKVTALTREVSEVLDLKYGVLDGKLAAEGVTAEIRRELLDHSEGVQSAKGALAATRVNYQAIGALIDAMSELEIKYRHAQADMVPLFQMQAKIACMGEEALSMQATLRDLAQVSERLMENNVKLVEQVTERTFDLLTTPIYDAEKAAAVERELHDYMGQLNERKKEWAALQTNVADLGAKLDAHFVEHS